MGWHVKFVICVQLAYVSVCLTQLSVVREWTSLDVQLSPGDGQESRRSILPSDVNSWLMYKDRVFVVLDEAEYSLAYLDLTDNSTSPLLQPYPSYENQQMKIHHPVLKVRVDRCDRLWVLSEKSMDDFRKHYIIVIDLKTDSILRNITFPRLYFHCDMIVDDFDCDNEYVYISDYIEVWTYSWADGDSWRHISESTLLTSMILAPNSIVYYNVVNEPTVYYMPTTDLKDKSNNSDISELGRSRKLNVYLYSSALDAKSDVLYYFNNDNKTVIHAVPCWTSERCSSNCQNDIDVGFDPAHGLRYITLDKNGGLWAITSRSSFEDGEINFRLLSVAIKSKRVESNANDTTNTSTDVESNTKGTTTTNEERTNTTNINESTTAASSTTEQTSTLGSVPKHTTVNTAGTPDSNITQDVAVGGTNVNYVNINLFSFTNFTSNFTINNFPKNFH